MKYLSIFALFCLVTTLSFSQSTAFTYQGQLKDANGLVTNANTLITFTLYSAASGGSVIGSPVTKNVNVQNGLFTVSPDFGSSIFTGADRWLEIKIGSVTLSPRQLMSPTPYSLYSQSTNGLSVDSSGNVGIATTSHLARVEINNGGGTAASLKMEHNGSNLIVRPLSAGGNSTVVENSASGNLILDPNNGYVGIGTTNPFSTLDVGGNVTVGDSGYLAIAFRGNGEVGADSGIGHSADGVISLISNGTERIKVVGSHVGIGTTSPTRTLSVGGLMDMVAFNAVDTCIINAGNTNCLQLFNSSPVSSNYPGLFVTNTNASPGVCAYFTKDVNVGGNLSKAGGSFKIDHPLDPANKYLYHSFVESPDMMNVYNGNITTNDNGYATVTLPEWFQTLNRDFRYQLTVVGDESDDFVMAKVARQVENNQFKIKTSKPNATVSWQVTGIRQDAWANAHRIPVEENKPDNQRGYYLHPELFGQPSDRNIDKFMKSPEPIKQGSK